MSTHLARLMPYLRRLAAPPDSDAELLVRFRNQRDQAAFTTMVERHGPMVLRVCERILGDRHAAEDACQAVFLVLARRADSLGAPGSLAPWLHGTAQRVAWKARGRRRRMLPMDASPEPPDPAPDPLARLTARELVVTVEDEVRRLPAAYRLAVTLCLLDALSQEEAAARLGCSPGALRGRLERGRQRLHERLKRRGIAIASVMAAVEAARVGAANVPPRLVETMVQACCAASGADAIPPGVAALVKGEMTAMLLTKTALIVSALLMFGITGAGFALLLPGQAQPALAAPPPEENKADDLVEISSPVDGRVVFYARALRTGETLPASARLSYERDGQKETYCRLRPGDKVEAGQLLVLLDDREARDEARVCKARLNAAHGEERFALAGMNEGVARYQRALSLRQIGGAISEHELGEALLSKIKLEQEHIVRKGAIQVAEAESLRAEARVTAHQVRSPVHGVIVSLACLPAQGVKKYERLLRIGVTEADR